MRALALVVMLAACAHEPPAPEPAAEERDPEAVHRLMGETVSIERFKADLVVLRKAQSVTALQHKELAALVTLADETRQRAWSALLADDVAGYRRAIQISSDILQEVRGLIAIYEAEKRSAK